MFGRINGYNKRTMFKRIGADDDKKRAEYCDGILITSEGNYECGDITFFEGLKKDDVILIHTNGIVERIYDSADKTSDFMFTAHCNSNCIMCPMSEDSRKTPEEGYLEYILEKIDILPDDVAHICMTGGEPTMIREDFFLVVDKLRSKFQKTDFQLLTNGRSLSDWDFCKRVVDSLPRNTTIGVPLHAGTPRLYDKIAQVDNSYYQALNGIKNLLRLNQIVEVRVVVSKLNVDDMDNLAHVVIKEIPTVERVTFMGLEVMGNCLKNFDTVWMDYHDSFKMIENAIETLCDSGINTYIYNYPLCCVTPKYWLLSKQSITTHKIRYFDECDNCRLKAACGGFFISTKKFTNMKVNPIR